MKWMQKSFWTFLFISVAGVPSIALAGSITAEIDRTIGSIEDQFVFVVTVSGDADGEPKLPKVDGLTIQAAGTSTSKSWVNGTFSSQEAYNFVIVPDKVGTFTIPSIKLKIDDKMEMTAPITLKISEGGQPSTTVAGELPPIFVEREISAKDIYVGEQVISKVKVYHRIEIYEANGSPEKNPNFRKFSIEGQKNYTQVMNGQRYGVLEVSEILVPLNSGKIEVDPFVLKAKVAAEEPPRQHSRRRSMIQDFFGDDAFSRRRAVIKTLRSKPVTMNVKPLPSVNKPKDFSGLVGSFTMDAKVSSLQLQAGETSTLTVTIKGRGMLDALGELKWTFDPKIKTYADKPSVDQTVNETDGISGSKTYKIALVPTQAGSYDLGELKIPIFSPEIGTYVDLTAKLGTLEVTGVADEVAAGDSQRSASLPKSKVKVLAQDLLANHKPTALTDSQELRAEDAVILSLIAGLPFGLLLFGGLMFRFREKVAKGRNPSKARHSKAYANFKKHLADAKTFEQIDDCFRTYLGDKLDVQGLAFTSKEFVEKLKQKGLPEAELASVKALLSEFENLEYSGKKPTEALTQTLSEKVVNSVREIDRKL